MQIGAGLYRRLVSSLASDRQRKHKGDIEIEWPFPLEFGCAAYISSEMGKDCCHLRPRLGVLGSGGTSKQCVAGHGRSRGSKRPWVIVPVERGCQCLQHFPGKKAGLAA